MIVTAKLVERVLMNRIDVYIVKLAMSDKKLIYNTDQDVYAQAVWINIVTT